MSHYIRHLVFDQENNQLIFGNKKTRVALKTFATDNISQRVVKEFFTNEEIEIPEEKQGKKLDPMMEQYVSTLGKFKK